jgi:hypothetical protein
MALNDQNRNTEDSKISPGGQGQTVAKEREAERKEVAEMQERGTLTPESRKQGITSHLPESETAFMYRSEDDRNEKKANKEKP